MADHPAGRSRRRHLGHRHADLAGREVIRRDPGDRAPLLMVGQEERQGPVPVLRQDGRLRRHR